MQASLNTTVWFSEPEGSNTELATDSESRATFNQQERKHNNVRLNHFKRSNSDYCVGNI